jgi:hypothetical protein
VGVVAVVVGVAIARPVYEIGAIDAILVTVAFVATGGLRRETGRARATVAGAVPAMAAALLAVVGAVAGGRSAGAEDAPRPDRLREAREAETAIRGTFLFAEGRGMHVSPGVYETWKAAREKGLGARLTEMSAKRMGFVLEDGQPLGIFQAETSGVKVGVLGCVACHAGRAAGTTYVGLGNKSMDVGEVGRITAAVSAPAIWSRATKPPEERRLVEEAMRLTDVLTDPRWTNLTRGLVPVAMVRSWFYRQSGAPIPAEFPRGGVKPPHLWVYGEKRPLGLFCDGFGEGKEPGWAAATELTAGQEPAAVRRYAPRLRDVEDLFAKLLPPPFPGEIDTAAAERGRAVYAESCAGCHGTYRRDAQGLPVYAPPVHVAWESVRTDRDRLGGLGPEFRALVAATPLHDLLSAGSLPPGYFAPRLDGVWARFAYLHNASVPTLRDLLEPAGRRPVAWSLADAGERDRFDPVAVGYRVPPPGSPESADLARRGSEGDRDVYWTKRVGQSSVGHEFGVDLPAPSKSDLLEYLKSL